MKYPTPHYFKSAIAATAFLLVAVVSNSYAAIITSSLVNTSSQQHFGTAYDESTGKYYRRDSYVSNSFKEYNNLSAFESNTPSRTFSLAQANYGTYFEVKNGLVYTRTSTSTAAVATFDTTTGNLVNSSVIPSVSGSNSYSAFNWGGYSAVNFMSDGDNLYNFARSGQNNTDWYLISLNDDLTVSSSINTQINKRLGYSFIINDYLFTGDAYYSDNITGMYDINTGLLSTIDFSLSSLLSTNKYLTNFDYNSASDTLYISNLYGGGALHKVENASIQFGVASVPEPSILALMALGLIGLGFKTHRKNSVA